MKNRKGTVVIADDFFSYEESIKVLPLLFSRFFPMYIDHSFKGRSYHGISNDFDEVEEGVEPPIYDVIITRSVVESTRQFEYFLKFEKQKLGTVVSGEDLKVTFDRVNNVLGRS